jgi:hypothetical protein
MSAATTISRSPNAPAAVAFHSDVVRTLVIWAE